MRAPALAAALLALGLAAGGADLTAPQLIAKVQEAQATSGFRIRARLVHGPAGAEKPEVVQLLIKGRREGETVEVLYQALWPASLKGRALVVRKTPGQPVSGFLFEPPSTQRPLTPERLRQPLFGTDLAVEDVVEEFWSWPGQRLVGEERVLDRRCQILESRPAPGAATACASVKSWIAPDLALPLRVEKFGRGGELLRRFTAESLVRQGGRWTAAKVTVVPAGGRSRTVLEGTKSERDLVLPAGDFTAEGLRKALDAPTGTKDP